MPKPICSIQIEICVDSLTSAKIAAGLGAHRVELNSGLELGGLTPSIGLTQQTVEALKPTGCEVIALVRPRPGAFTYHQDEIRVMRKDIQQLLRACVKGVAVGVLASNGTIDEQANTELIKPVLDAGKVPVFHRAFDLTPDPIQALDKLVALGFERVLTSGQAPTAPKGAHLLRQLIKYARERIQVLPGSGITPHNVTRLVQATGCTQVHASLREVIEGPPSTANSDIVFYSAPPEGGGHHQADPNKIAAMMQAF